MEIRQLEEGYAVSPQISPEDLTALAAEGFTTIICNRPDGEVPPELQATIVGAATEAAGLTFVVNPILPGQMTQQNVDVQADAIAASAGRVFAYCQSGNRSSIVWSLVRLPELGTDSVLSATRNVGYDHEAMRQHYEQLERQAKG